MEVFFSGVGTTIQLKKKNIGPDINGTQLSSKENLGYFSLIAG